MLAMYVAIAQPLQLGFSLDALPYVAKIRALILDETVAGVQPTFRRYTEVATAGAAWIGPMRSPMDFANRGRDIGERISLPPQCAAFELLAALDHLSKHTLER